MILKACPACGNTLIFVRRYIGRETFLVREIETTEGVLATTMKVIHDSTRLNDIYEDALERTVECSSCTYVVGISNMAEVDDISTL